MNAVLTAEPAFDIGIADDCPVCAGTAAGNPRFNATTLAAFEETKAIMRGELPAKRYKPHEIDQAWKDLLDD